MNFISLLIALAVCKATEDFKRLEKCIPTNSLNELLQDENKVDSFIEKFDHSQIANLNKNESNTENNGLYNYFMSMLLSDDPDIYEKSMYCLVNNFYDECYENKKYFIDIIQCEIYYKLISRIINKNTQVDNNKLSRKKVCLLKYLIIEQSKDEKTNKTDLVLNYILRLPRTAELYVLFYTFYLGRIMSIIDYITEGIIKDIEENNKDSLYLKFLINMIELGFAAKEEYIFDLIYDSIQKTKNSKAYFENNNINFKTRDSFIKYMKSKINDDNTLEIDKAVSKFGFINNPYLDLLHNKKIKSEVLAKNFLENTSNYFVVAIKKCLNLYSI